MMPRTEGRLKRVGNSLFGLGCWTIKRGAHEEVFLTAFLMVASVFGLLTAVNHGISESSLCPTVIIAKGIV